MTKFFIATSIVAMATFLIISGTRVHRLMDAPNKIEKSLGVLAPVDSEWSEPLRNVEIFADGYVKIETIGIASDPTTWVTSWYRRSDVKFEKSTISEVRWIGDKVLVEHQDPLSRHGILGLKAKVISANVWNLQIYPALYALSMGLVLLLVMLRLDQKINRGKCRAQDQGGRSHARAR